MCQILSDDIRPYELLYMCQMMWMKFWKWFQAWLQRKKHQDVWGDYDQDDSRNAWQNVAHGEHDQHDQRGWSLSPAIFVVH